MELNKTELAQIAEIEKIIVKAKGKFGISDICAETGFSANEVDSLMNVLLERYKCRLKMNPDNGRLQFNFAVPLRRRDEITFREKYLRFVNYIYKIFKATYKVAFGVMMAVYSIVYVIILLAISIAGASSDDRKSRASSEAVMRLTFSFAGYIMDVLFNRETLARREVYVVDGERRYRTYREEKPSFVKSAFQFVFGPEYPKFDPLNDAKEVIAYLRQKNGKLTAGEIIALSGVTFDEAESRLAEYAGKFNGELRINENGTIEGEFDRIIQKENSALQGGKIEFYADEIEPPVSYTGNQDRDNTNACVLNVFNLVMACFITFGGADFFDGNSIIIAVLLGVIPLIISLLFFIIPLIRIPSVIKRKKQREINLIRKYLIEYIIKQNDRINKNSIAMIANRGKFDPVMTKNVLDRLVIEMRGEVKISEDGSAIYDFARLKREIK